MDLETQKQALREVLVGLDQAPAIGEGPWRSALREHVRAALDLIEQQIDARTAAATQHTSRPRLADRIVLINARLGQSAPPQPAAAPAAVSPAAFAAAIAKADSPRDDLTRVRGITSQIAERLAGIGVTRFSDIAQWSNEDVRRVSGLLGLDRRITRQSWVVQAAMLYQRQLPAAATSTHVAGGATGEPPATSPGSPTEVSHADAGRVPEAQAVIAHAPAEAPVTEQPAAAVPAPATTPPALVPGSNGAASDVDAGEAVQADDFTRIAGLSAALAARLAEYGYTGFGDVAAITATGVARLRLLLGTEARDIGQWIEQAQILASGGTTFHLRRKASQPALTLVSRPPANDVHELPAELLARVSCSVEPERETVDAAPALPPPLPVEVARGRTRPDSGPDDLLGPPLAGPPPGAPAQPDLAQPDLAQPDLARMEPLAVADEADVMIVVHPDPPHHGGHAPRPPTDAAGTVRAERPQPIAARARRLEPRERSASVEPYAGYFGVVEEASVEIVPAGSLPPPGEAEPAGGDGGPDKVGRLLKALTGDQRR